MTRRTINGPARDEKKGPPGRGLGHRIRTGGNTEDGFGGHPGSASRTANAAGLC
jgi:hypothetical protein